MLFDWHAPWMLAKICAPDDIRDVGLEAFSLTCAALRLDRAPGRGVRVAAEGLPRSVWPRAVATRAARGPVEPIDQLVEGGRGARGGSKKTGKFTVQGPDERSLTEFTEEEGSTG
eukprot:8074273-Pyramimonas_sp.AAC.1